MEQRYVKARAPYNKYGETYRWIILVKMSEDKHTVSGISYPKGRGGKLENPSTFLREKGVFKMLKEEWNKLPTKDPEKRERCDHRTTV